MTWDILVCTLIALPVSYALVALAVLVKDLSRPDRPDRLSGDHPWNGIDHCCHPAHPPDRPQQARWETRDLTPCPDLDGEGGGWTALCWCDEHAPADSIPAV